MNPAPRLGADILEIERFAAACRRSNGRILRRLFTESERSWCDARPDPVLHYAARFAAKEAVLKLLGTGWTRGIGFAEIEVVRDEAGAPSILLHGRARAFAQGLRIGPIGLTLSHSKGLALAVAVANRE